jgi:hypothetical protein
MARVYPEVKEQIPGVVLYQQHSVEEVALHKE